MPLQVNHKKKVEPKNFSQATAPTQKKLKRKKEKPSILKKNIKKEKKAVSVENCVSVLSDDLNQNVQNDRLYDDVNSILNSLGDLSLSIDLNLLSQKIIHNKSFREYCNQKVDFQLNEIAFELLKDLFKFQDRQYHQNPEKTRYKKRLVFGFHEISKYIVVNKIKGVIIAPDIQKILVNGILDQTVNKLIKDCEDKSIPFVFACSRKLLGSLRHRKCRVSCIGIINYDNKQVQFNQLLELTNQAKTDYQVTCQQLKQFLSTLDDHSLQSLAFEIEKKKKIPSNLLDFRKKLVDKNFEKKTFMNFQ